MSHTLTVRPRRVRCAVDVGTWGPRRSSPTLCRQQDWRITVAHVPVVRRFHCRARLSYFDTLDEVAEGVTRLVSAHATPNPADVIPLLDRLDMAVTYIGDNMHFKDAAVYTARLKALQKRAVGILRAAFSKEVKHTTQHVLSALVRSRCVVLLRDRLSGRGGVMIAALVLTYPCSA